jgi:DNA replication and repair protein RecF
MIHKISLVNFKSHKSLDLDLESNKVAIIGKNATGKTNILESIYYAFITKSYFGTQSSLITRDEDFMKLIVDFSLDKNRNIEYRLKQSPKSVSRTISLDGVKKRAADIIGLQPIVIFIPDDVLIVTGGPQYRRNLLNSILVQTSKDYLMALNRFQKILNQRNRLLYNLKNGFTNSKDQIFVYNLQLAEPISVIYKYRYELINYLNKNLSSKYSAISSGSDKVCLEYLNSLPKEKDDILSSLEVNVDNDLALGFTAKGPHKDELTIALNGFSARDNLSRGENRSLSLAIKLAELDYIDLHSENPPLLMLDDVLSELDEDRQKHLLEHSEKHQVIITSTEIADNISDYQIVRL